MDKLTAPYPSLSDEEFVAMINTKSEMEVNYQYKCDCKAPNRAKVNYEMMWHEADIICLTCRGFVRFWDAG